MTATVIHQDEYCTITLDGGLLAVAMEHETLVPGPGLYPGMTPQGSAKLFRELVDSGIPESVAWLWTDQALGLDEATDEANEGQAIVEAAYNAVKSPSGRARLADMRRVAGLAREAFDAALEALEAAGKAVLYGLDDPREIRPEDEQGAYWTVLGDVRHIMHMGNIG